MYSYNYAVSGSEKNRGANSLEDFNVIENSYVADNKNDLDLYSSVIKSDSDYRNLLNSNTLELKGVLDISKIVNSFGFTYDMYGLNIMARYNRFFYRFLAESFVRNFASVSKNRFDILSVLVNKDIDYLYEYCVYLLFHNNYTKGNLNAFTESVKERYKENYSAKVLLEEAIKEMLFKLRGTDVFNEDLEFLCKDYLSNNVDFVSKRKRKKILLQNKKKILEDGYWKGFIKALCIFKRVWLLSFFIGFNLF